MRKVQFGEGEYYHIYNRGVDKRDVFLSPGHYERFLFLLFACNDSSQMTNASFFLRYYGGFASIEKYERKGDTIVDIVCFCLMPNHYHLLLREKTKGGISLFMQKLGTAYTMFFNIKHKRSGVLFQGTFKAIHVDAQGYLSHLVQYIHLNPAELREPQWKKEGIADWKSTYAFIRDYPWSSYSDYLGTGRLPQLLNSGLIRDLYGENHPHEAFMREWLVKDKSFLMQDDLTMEVSPP